MAPTLKAICLSLRMHFQPVEPTGDDMPLSHSQGDNEPLPNTMNDTLDDVFGGGDDLLDEDHVHPSDMRRLEAEHSTAGYREGIAQGKDATLQKGFDQGYPVGAAIGLQAGQLLGLLEGISEAVKASQTEASARVEQLLSDARTDLGVDSIFSSQYWTGTGELSYEVKTAESETAGTAHPLIRKWTGVIHEEADRWGINRDILAHVNPEGPKDPVVEEPEQEEQASTTRNPLDW